MKIKYVICTAAMLTGSLHAAGQTYTGAFHCSPLPGSAVKADVNVTAELTIKNGVAQMRRSSSKYEELLEGRVRGTALTLEGQGYFYDRPVPWTTRLTGKLNGNTYRAQGEITNNKGENSMACEVSLGSEDALQTAAPATAPIPVTSRIVSNPQVIAPIAVPALVPKQELQSGSDASDKSKTIPAAAVPPIVHEKPLALTANQPPVESRATPASIETAAIATATPPAVVNERTYPVYPKFEQPVSSYQEAAPPKASGISTGLLTMYGVVLVLILFTNAGYAAYKHRHGTLTIYQDLTDATFTGLAPMISVLFYLALRLGDVKHASASVLALCVFGVLMWYVVKSTYRNNEFPLGFAMALVAKLTVVFAYYAYLVMLWSSGSSRRQGESRSAFDARMNRELKSAMVKTGAATVAMMAFSRWISRSDEFIPLMDYCYPTNTNMAKRVEIAETSEV